MRKRRFSAESAEKDAPRACRRMWFSHPLPGLFLPLGAALTALCLVLPRIGFLEWVTLIPALCALFALAGDPAVKLRRLYGWGLLFYFSFYFVVYHWFVKLWPMEFAGIGKGEAALLVAVCWVGLSLLQTVFSALVFPLFGALCRTRVLRRFPLLAPFVFAAQWAVAEWSQTLTFAGVPWARLPLGQLHCGFLLNSAAVAGSYLLTFALVAVNGLAAFLLRHPARARAAAALAAAVFLLHAAAGLSGYLLAQRGEGQAVTVAAVQGNVGSSGKWDADTSARSREIYDRCTAAAAEAGAEIVVFPETFIPAELTDSSTLGLYVRELARRYGVTILCGAYHTDEAGDRYNAVFAVLPDGSISDTVYAKRHLVPFGEYVPMRGLVEALFPPLADIGMLSYDLAAGKDSAIFDTSSGRVGALICFDSIYEALTRASVRDGAQLLCLPTNDSWFTDSAAVYMHSGQARLRAIEQGRWIVRAADTGISSIIAPDGSSFAELPPLTEGVSLYPAHLRDARTPYSCVGNLFVYLLIAALLAIPAGSAARRIRAMRRVRAAQRAARRNGI